MKYHIYIQDEEAGDIAQTTHPATEGVGYLVEDRFEAENSKSHQNTQEWIAQLIQSRPRDPFCALGSTGKKTVPDALPTC